MVNIPESEIETIKATLPGVTAPTVMPLLGREGWVAVHAVIHENDVNLIISELRQHQAEGLLILPIERMVS
jgi:ATP phosphoribosyltransferase